MTEPLQLVGPGEISALLHVSRTTVHTWRQRGILPEPEWVISGVPVWRRETILEWSARTGHPKPSPY